MTVRFMEASRFRSRTSGSLLSEIQPIGLRVKWLLTDECTIGTSVISVNGIGDKFVTQLYFYLMYYCYDGVLLSCFIIFSCISTSFEKTG